MSKSKKIFLIIIASLVTLLVLSNSFFIYLLANAYQADKQAEMSALDPFSEWNAKKQLLLRYTPNSTVDPDRSKYLVTQTIKDNPSILRDEPIILIANPALKPLVAEILEEEPSILEEDPLTLYKYPELMELNPNLKPILNSILERTENPNITSLFS